MKKIILMGLLSIFISKSALAENVSFYEHKAKLLNGEEFDFTSLKGKVALVVNTASKCGFTSQYEGLQKTYEQYKAQGLVILGFPSNDFGAQEPGDADEIKKFCKLNYGVDFPLFAKGPVSGGEKQLSYKILTEQSNKEFQGDPGWNFVKFLVDKKGNVRGRFKSIVGPQSEELTSKIEELLKEE